MNILTEKVLREKSGNFCEVGKLQKQIGKVKDRLCLMINNEIENI